ncbi:hypothetical protein CgunFtcFv8_010063 [Champsocephalus gunnari]|uniref:diacylglycerol kinase (ATP) n=1 Tax=Champsocephalus gunnari TaxID=52237 RepID=A0AAN8DUV6_CHAGU|nr:hypothetical protein CgunFtcFv8_010063 [Champsocephalus gunnari]
MAAAEGPEPRCPEDSSDSEPEQEPGSPQKLIRKVSTSGQISSKVRGGGGGLPDRIPGQRLFCSGGEEGCSPVRGSGGRRAVPRSEAAGGGGLFPGQRQRGEEGCSPVRGSGGRRSLSPLNSTVLKEGFLQKQSSSFQRGQRRYFKLRGRTLYYAQTPKSIIFDEVDLTDASAAESSTKNVNNSFTVITPCRRLTLVADSRKEMEEWMAALRSVQNTHNYESTQYSMDHFRRLSGGVTSTGLSCEVCKFKAHKRCAVRATNNCKWTTLASIGKDIIEDEDGISMPHQWLEGNLSVSAKCSVCEKTCGSVLRLQDLKCLWCKAMVHAVCKDQLSSKCPLGQCKVSVIPPTALNSIDSDGFWKASCPPSCTSPLLVFVNSKSGHNQGVKFLRRFKQLLNPAQVFDLMNGGPHLGLRLFQKFDTFRILVCGGDGSVGWVLSDIDALTLHKQCQLGVLPLGTGNDLARVLGWGSACDDDTQLPQILEKLERASTKMLDRWSIMVYETKFPRQHSASTEDCSDDSEAQQILTYEDSVAAHLTKILTSDQHSVVISSARVLCETVKDFVARVGKAYEKNKESSTESEAMSKKCVVLKEKLDSLLKTLSEESQATSAAIFKPREQLMLRANSLKKAIRQVIEHTERAVDEQNAQTLFCLGGEEGLLEEDEEDKMSLQSSCSTKRSHKVSKTPCEKLISKEFLSMGSSASLPVQTGSDSENMLNSKILYPGLSSSSVISRLLVNADPFSCDPDNIDCYTEKCVMNNYFGIGLDAKISLDFNNKRDEHPEKCRYC